jgi:NADPH:quinone reductase-like Zn-dependent oxidoreductase
MKFHRRWSNFVAQALLLTVLTASLGAAGAPPAKMQAIIVQSQGAGPQSLQLQSVDTPRPGPNQVLIRVYAAGVNPVDWKSATAGAIPGFDNAGVLDTVGAGVTTFKPGDAVVARAAGAYAQYVVAELDSLVRKPGAFTFEQAAGMPVAGIAGYRAATEVNLQPGQRVAVIGAAGGAGSAAVETAKSLGARVIGIGHSSQQVYLRNLGVAEFVAYDKEQVAAAVRDVDAALNMVDNQADAALGYVRRGGYLSSIAGMPAAGKCEAAGVTCVQIGRGKPGPPTVQSLRPLAALADAGKYTVTVTRRFPLAQAGDAQDYLRQSEGVGKTILVVDPANAGRR